MVNAPTNVEVMYPVVDPVAFKLYVEVVAVVGRDRTVYSIPRLLLHTYYTPDRASLKKCLRLLVGAIFFKLGMNTLNYHISPLAEVEVQIRFGFATTSS